MKVCPNTILALKFTRFIRKDEVFAGLALINSLPCPLTSEIIRRRHDVIDRICTLWLAN